MYSRDSIVRGTFVELDDLVRRRTNTMTGLVTENKPDFRSEVSWEETRAYEGQLTLRDGRNDFRLPVNIKFSQCDTKIMRGLKIIEQ